MLQVKIHRGGFAWRIAGPPQWSQSPWRAAWWRPS